ncbi:CRISPR-associated protein Cas5 [Saccharolobus shibatae B12]|uniref:CRISPR-associated protein Cas5 n=2 Tax=Saccharolobus shibatae TaxID=2286 RepID=A0A8F5BNZ5_SACSH|nr:type I-A CRISPR-associated protein Cas5a [Saccharolobus shibatae]QXJ28805.1 CRISPR-associated protein Cas5 [Saccharolobus shibatae B12]QXJ35103.1 CRISPR-associated protein Cas5 [Saccharolobus shibatae]
MKGVVIFGIHHWGFSVRVPRTSAGGSSYIVPPITTILGALSRGYCTDYAVKNNVSCTKEFIDKFSSDLFWVTYGTEEHMLMPYSDLLREERVPYRQSKNRSLDHVSDWFGVSAFGKVYCESVNFSILLLLNKENSEFWSKLGWQIISLGTKESLVTITDVKVVDVEESSDEDIYTIYYIPAECLTNTEEFEVVNMPVKNVYELSSKPSIGAFSNFLVPRKTPFIGGKVKVKKSDVRGDICKVYKMADKYVITLKEGLGRWYSK